MTFATVIAEEVTATISLRAFMRPMPPTSQAGRVVYQIASATRWGRNTGLSTAELTYRTAHPLPATTRPVRAAAAGIGEGCALLALDVAAVTVVSLAAGSFWAVALIRAAVTALGVSRSRPVPGTAAVLRPRRSAAHSGRCRRGRGRRSMAGRADPRARSPSLPMIWAAVMLAAVVTGRVIGYRMLRSYRRRSPGRATIVVGSGDLAVRARRRAARGPHVRPGPGRFRRPADR